MESHPLYLLVWGNSCRLYLETKLPVGPPTYHLSGSQARYRLRVPPPPLSSPTLFPCSSSQFEGKEAEEGKKPSDFQKWAREKKHFLKVSGLYIQGAPQKHTVHTLTADSNWISLSPQPNPWEDICVPDSDQASWSRCWEWSGGWGGFLPTSLSFFWVFGLNVSHSFIVFHCRWWKSYGLCWN